ncbi:Tetratricopeptide repeat protein 4, partial [Eschrichtius robustus]|nr:Tetratricopeptide repeat protein 4 [Eschrichtius robustus]
MWALCGLQDPKLQRTEQRDIRKAKLKEKKEQNQNEALLQAIVARNIRLVSEAAGEDEDSASEGLGELILSGLTSENLYGARLSVDDGGRLSWPVLFLYPEYAQSDFISAFHEDSRFIDHLMVMFGETPSWDLEQKYCPDNLEVHKIAELKMWVYKYKTKVYQDGGLQSGSWRGSRLLPLARRVVLGQHCGSTGS